MNNGPRLAVNEKYSVHGVVHYGTKEVLTIVLMTVPFFYLVVRKVRAVVLNSGPSGEFLNVVGRAIRLATKCTLSISLLMVNGRTVAVGPVRTFFNDGPGGTVFVLHCTCGVVTQWTLLRVR